MIMDAYFKFKLILEIIVLAIIIIGGLICLIPHLWIKLDNKKRRKKVNKDGK